MKTALNHPNDIISAMVREGHRTNGKTTLPHCVAIELIGALPTDPATSDSVKRADLAIEQVISLVSAYESDADKQAALAHLVLSIVESASRLTTDDLGYLYAQFIFAQQHPGVLQLQLQRVCDRHHPLSDAQLSDANPASAHLQSTADLAPAGAVQPHLCSVQPVSPLSASLARDDLA